MILVETTEELIDRDPPPGGWPVRRTGDPSTWPDGTLGEVSLHDEGQPTFVQYVWLGDAWTLIPDSPYDPDEIEKEVYPSGVPTGFVHGKLFDVYGRVGWALYLVDCPANTPGVAVRINFDVDVESPEWFSTAIGASDANRIQSDLELVYPDLGKQVMRGCTGAEAVKAMAKTWNGAPRFGWGSRVITLFVDQTPDRVAEDGQR